MTVLEFERWVLWFYNGAGEPEGYNFSNYLKIPLPLRLEIRKYGLRLVIEEGKQ